MIHDLYDLYDLVDLYDLAHDPGWEPYHLDDLEHVYRVGCMYYAVPA